MALMEGADQGMLGGAIEGATVGSSFGPYGLALGAALGLGLELFGGTEKYKASQEQTQAQIDMIQAQQQQDVLRQQMMHVQGRRAQTQVLRVEQQKAAMGLAAAANQGAQYGSGAQGAQAQVRAESGVNLLGINQNVAAGDQMFAIERQVDAAKIAYAKAGGKYNEGQGLMQLGSGITHSLPALKGLMGPSPLLG